MRCEPVRHPQSGATWYQTYWFSRKHSRGPICLGLIGLLGFGFHIRRFGVPEVQGLGGVWAWGHPRTVRGFQGKL